MATFTYKRIRKQYDLVSPWASVLNQQRQFKFDFPALDPGQKGKIVRFRSVFWSNACTGQNQMSRMPEHFLTLQDGAASLANEQRVEPGEAGFVERIMHFPYPGYDGGVGTIYVVFQPEVNLEYTIARAPLYPEKPILWVTTQYENVDATIMLDLLVRVEEQSELETVQQLYGAV